QDAPVTIVEYTDYQCPFCRRFHSDGFAQLKRQYIDSGKVRFITRDLPLPIHPNAVPAAQAIRCAGDQGKFWEMRDAIANANDLAPASISKYAQQVGIDTSALATCMTTGRHRSEIDADIASAGALGITGTPAFLVARTASEMKGELVVGVPPSAAFDELINRMLASPPAGIAVGATAH